MNKLLVKLLSICLALTAVFTLVGCQQTGSGSDDGGTTGGGGEGEHVHDYIDHKCSCGETESYTPGLEIKEITLNGETFCTVMGLGEAAELTEIKIPQKNENNVPVKRIGIGAFKDAAFTKITLPVGLEVISKEAFMNGKFYVITIPASVTKIEPAAFSGCEMLDRVTFVKTEYWNVSLYGNTLDSGWQKKENMENASWTASQLTEVKHKYDYGNCNWIRYDSKS